MDLDAYVAEHAGQWRRLEDLARRRRLGPEEADELVALYQRAATHLSVIRSRSPDPALVARLSRIVLTARSGRHAFRHRLAALGLQVPEERMQETWEGFLRLADTRKEVTDSDLRDLVTAGVR